MALPDDFGISAVSTLARVGDPTPAREHSVFWSHWLSRVGEAIPSLVERRSGGKGASEPDPTDETCTHAIESLGGVRIGARLVLPPKGVEIRGGVVSTHGYAVSRPISERDSYFEHVAARGLAVLNIRIRGFAGSRLDVGDLQTQTEPGLGWMTRGLDEPKTSSEGTMEWVYAQGVADVFQACRALRWWLVDRGVDRGSEGASIFLHGESFGGGLALPAAAKLVGRGAECAHIGRLVLGLPTMGDWPWRLEHPISGGSGAEIALLIERRPELADLIRLRLRLLDSVVHAGRVRCPVLCKLAERDQIVPAPTAAAIFNATRVDPGMKWRFVVPHGHAETGLANARRHLEFDRCMADFFDPANEPAVSMRPWADRLHVETEPAENEASPTLFDAEAPAPDAVKIEIAKQYSRVGRTLDDLPYTDDFEQLWSALAKATNMGRREFFHKLHNLRKAGDLPRLGRAVGSPPRISPQDERELAGLVIAELGTLGQRDRLPYTPEFDRIVEAFTTKTGRELSRHDCWRLIAKLAK